MKFYRSTFIVKLFFTIAFGSKLGFSVTRDDTVHSVTTSSKLAQCPTKDACRLLFFNGVKMHKDGIVCRSRCIILSQLKLQLGWKCGECVSPTNAPVSSPIKAPTKSPIVAPVNMDPVKSPTRAPVNAPTKALTNAPVSSPINVPTKSPTRAPINMDPAKSPTKAPAKTPASNYNIQLDLSTISPTTDQALFAVAATRWQSIITGDLLDFASSDFPPRDDSCQWPTVIDDLFICAGYKSIDGPEKVLGFGSPEYIRLPSALPISGTMTFDLADLAYMRGTGTFQDVILHEMGHVLGTLAWIPLVANYGVLPLP
jgi:hypothetical protein